MSEARFEVFTGRSWEPIRWDHVQKGHIIRRTPLGGGEGWVGPYIATERARTEGKSMGMVPIMDVRLDYDILTIDRVLPALAHEASEAFLTRVRANVAEELARLKHPAADRIDEADVHIVRMEETGEAEVRSSIRMPDDDGQDMVTAVWRSDASGDEWVEVIG